MKFYRTGQHSVLKHPSSANELKIDTKSVRGNGKKKIAWHTTFGNIEIQERLFIQPGKQFRPFSHSAGISNRGCSLPLQRVIVDFGADHAFGRVPYKLTEHYGIEIATSTIQALTEKHANQMYEQFDPQTIPNKVGCGVQIGEMDGSMIPIVSIDEEAKDKRKNKTLSWKEARLSMAPEKGSTSPKFGAVFQGNVDDAGQCLLNSAVLAGFGTQTHLHVVGDGAPWYASQVDYKFGSQGHYLVDFYHVCEYLAEAAKSCANDHEKNWLETQKNALKNNEYKQVIHNLKPYLEADNIEDHKAPVRACHRYLSNRTSLLIIKQL